MGNILEKKKDKEQIPIYEEKYEDFQLVNTEKNSFGNLKIVQNKITNKLYKEKNLQFDSDEKLSKIITALNTIKKDEENFYLKVHSIKLIDNRLYCSASNISIVFDFFENTLEDNLKDQKFYYSEFSEEYKIWGLILDITRILEFEIEDNTSNNFLHPESIFFNREKKKWCLIHSYFFDCDNFTYACAQKTHYSSPELYCQIKSKNKSFKLPNNSKSNIFSLGLIILKCIFLEELDLNKIYKKEILSLNFIEISLLLDGLEYKGYSVVLKNVLSDMLNELENLRSSSQMILKNLENYKEQLTTKDFKDFDKVLSSYHVFKSKNDNLSFEAYGNNNYDPEKNFTIDEHFLLEESDIIRNNDIEGYTKNGKKVKIDEKFLVDDSFEDRFY